jgi:hypothetical protein
MDWLMSLNTLEEETIGLMIPIIAIVSVFLCGVILGLTKFIFRHRERMAMIERGMHPDLVEPEEDEALIPTV